MDYGAYTALRVDCVCVRMIFLHGSLVYHELTRCCLSSLISKVRLVQRIFPFNTL
jgi:hypothetical protein